MSQDTTAADATALKARVAGTLTARARRARLMEALFTPAADGDEALRQVVGEVLAAR